jgi:mono/diheme cytochrome c family protein
MKMISKLLVAAVGTAYALSAADTQAGKTVFEKSCRMCHGPDGQGNPAIAKAMNVTMRPLSSAEVQARSDGEIKKIVLEGNGKMKPVKLTDAQVADVIAYLRTLAKSK